jgi:ATP-dependent phosphofructokinase / diphosphate-dependent phosphofructokinase
MARRVGICTGGGDAPGLNAVIRAFVRHATLHLDLEVVGIEDSFNGLLSDPRRVRALDVDACRGLLPRGGTVLGTTNRGDPFAFPDPDGAQRDRAPEIAAAVRELGLEGIVCIGGDGTQAISLRLMDELGVKMIGVPKTIDNDLGATDLTFGFLSAVDVATDALDRLHTTAESHDRVMFLEVMGRDAGHIALWAGIAGGADVILIPEIPYDPARVAQFVCDRVNPRRSFALIVVAEGALPIADAELTPRERKGRLASSGGAANIAKKALEPHVQAEMRVTVLGHIQRGGSPVPFDRILASRFGVGAAELVAAGRWGEMVRLRNNTVEGVSLREAVAKQKLVDPGDELVHVARALGLELGAEP